MNKEKIEEYLRFKRAVEQKWMYHFQVTDPDFGVETDMYSWCDRCLKGKVPIEFLLDYFKKYYAKDEINFIKTIEKLLRE